MPLKAIAPREATIVKQTAQDCQATLTKNRVISHDSPHIAPFFTQSQFLRAQVGHCVGGRVLGSGWTKRGEFLERGRLLSEIRLCEWNSISGSRSLRAMQRKTPAANARAAPTTGVGSTKNELTPNRNSNAPSGHIDANKTFTAVIVFRDHFPAAINEVMVTASSGL